jgi:hypothetical protein
MLTRCQLTAPDVRAWDDFFANGRCTPVEVNRDGRRAWLTLPLRYYDWSMMFASFPASAAAIRAILPSRKLVPVELFPGLSVVTLVAFNHRRVEGLDEYNEISVMMPVRREPRWNVPLVPLLFPHWFDDLGFWVQHLPVTTQAACDAGVEIWGFPKVVHDLTFEDTAGVRRCVWRDAGRVILTFDMVTAAPGPERRMNFVAYSRKDGRLAETLFETKAPYFQTRWPGGARFALGDHPLAAEFAKFRMWNIAVGRVFAARGLSMLHGPGRRISM